MSKILRDIIAETHDHMTGLTVRDALEASVWSDMPGGRDAFADRMIAAIAERVAARPVSEAEVARLRAARVPEGWCLVPIEPTVEMLEEADRRRALPESYIVDVWDAMVTSVLSSAPAPKRRSEDLTVDELRARIGRDQAALLVKTSHSAGVTYPDTTAPAEGER